MRDGAASRARADTAADGFALATPPDDAALRALLRHTVMPGAVRVAFTREPSYFAGEGLGGATDYTLAHRTEGALDGVARLSVHVLYRNGIACRAGYLGELRVDSRSRRGARLLRDGYALLRQYVAAERLDGCFTSIAHDNARARRVLEHGGRLGLPAYVPIADLVTLVARVPRRAPGSAPVETDAASNDHDALTTYLDRRARLAQLTLTWNAGRWPALARHGLEMRHFRVIREQRRIVGAGAVWDQRAFRQVRVMGYSGVLRALRPIVSGLACVGAGLPLPPPGSILAQGMITAASVDDSRHWPALLRALLSDAAARGLHWVTIAREASDPELPLLRRLLRAREYHTRLYHVRWPDLPAWTDAWHGTPCRPEVGVL